MNSLRTRLLVTIGASLVVLWTAVAAWMMVELRGELRTALDDRLAASARMVAGLALQFPTRSLAGETSATPLLDVVARDGLACEVSLVRGEVSVQKVARTASSPALDDASPGYSTGVYGGKLWRIYVLHQGGLRIATADRIDARETLLKNVALTAAVPFGVALVGTLFAVWLGIGGGLAPLERIRRGLAERRPDDDSPLPSDPVPRELRPLVGTIARLLERVRGTIARERRFTDDAAHELRTPLTAVKTHLQVLRLALARNKDAEEIGDALVHADQGVLRMQRTLEQLLLLARLEGGEETDHSVCADSSDAVTQAVAEVETSRGSPGRIKVEAPPDSRCVHVPEPLLVSALRNLLENAVRASADGAPVELRVESGANGVVRFEVLDRGPGMSEEECGMATRRFWRRSKAAGGSGLGLAIVQAVAQRHGGSVRLHPRPEGGLRAELELPASA
jgi:two-component system, OmpR family, sensor histidine kinase QseC